MERGCRAMDPTTLARHIDQTLLKPTVGLGEAHSWMEQHAHSGFAALCVSPFLVPLASQILADSETLVCSVCGFPLGYSNTETKADEAGLLVGLGCREVDMVMNVAALLEGETSLVEDDIRAVVDATAGSSDEAIVKVILETGYLDDGQIVRACEAAVAAGADYVKTSTGFGPRGASVHDVEVMRAAVGPEIGVKAAGGIRDLDTALAMLEAGADRLGASAGHEIVEALEHRG
jgi:deoxyribose-phosphate aldolase